MSLRYGIQPVDPSRRICFNCQHFCVDVDPHSGWGICDIGKNSGFFRNHCKYPERRTYMARHSNVRYYTQMGCKVRFKAVTEDA